MRCGGVAEAAASQSVRSGGLHSSLHSSLHSLYSPSILPSSIHSSANHRQHSSPSLSIPLSAPCNVVLASSLLTPTPPFDVAGCHVIITRTEDGGRGRPTRPLLFTPSVRPPRGYKSPVSRVALLKKDGVGRRANLHSDSFLWPHMPSAWRAKIAY